MRITSLYVVAVVGIALGCAGGSETVAPLEDQQFRVEVRGSGTGAGQVRSVGSTAPPLTCSVTAGVASCSTSVPEGSQLQLEAAPSSGSDFAGWELDASACGTAPRCSIGVNNSLTIGARFEVHAAAAPDASTSVLAAAPTTIAPGEITTLMIIVKDAEGNGLPDIPVTLSATGEGNSITPSTSTTNASGVATFTFSSTEVGAKSVTAVAGGVTLLQQAIVSVVGQGGEGGGGNESTNASPIASNDSFEAAQGLDEESIFGAPGVLVNDSDPEGARLSATLVTGTAFGNVRLNPDGSFSYTPFPLYTGSDSFTYRVSDGVNTSNTATVTITVSGTQPRPTALCKDGTLSYSAHRQGTCSHHGGVLVWY